MVARRAYDKGSIYGRLQRLTDIREERGKRYSLTTLLMIVLLAKLSGADSLMAVAEWGNHYQGEIEIVLRIKPKRMPERMGTYRRLLAYKVYETEIERMVGEYNQSGERGDICALDGKALLGMLKREDGTSEYALSVYDVQAGKTIAQVEVGSKENEITKAPAAIKLAKIAGKVVTRDALHTQKRLAQTILDEKGDYVFPVKENQANLYKNIQALFAPEYPKPLGNIFGKNWFSTFWRPDKAIEDAIDSMFVSFIGVVFHVYKYIINDKIEWPV